MTTHDTAAILMALDNFKHYAAAKIEVYNEALVEMGSAAPVHVAPSIDRERIDAWKVRIRSGDDDYPQLEEQ